MNTEDAKQRIKELVDSYTKLAEEKRIGKYNEEMTKKDFILPLFEALGWNVYNKPNKTDNVSAEETISKKRVDYGFRINGIPKFLLEAKAIPVDLNKTKFAEQAINYSWHKGCTWAVLTDFEGIKVFNAEWKSRNVSENLFLNLSWRDYLDHFDKLWLLSKESFEKGLLDKKAELYGKKSKKIPVDKQLLTDFTRFRELLSKDITKLNPGKGLTEEELDESVQRILDRLIFIRNCEDRELEARKLMPALRDWESVGKKGQLLKQLRAIFNYFDEQYNSKLFQEHLCDSLEISDNVLNEVVYGLYQTKDKAVYYDFSAIEADVLGNIYEQYLGHILRKTAKRAKVTESHARRKEHGIYYTPPYIVDYIVRNTLEELLKRRRPNEIEKIRVLDPACGSGSFLIKSFDILNEYWKEKDKDYAQAQLDITGKGTTFTRKVKVLQNNIFGVDLDKQAVEIAQLNLLLKITEKGHRLPLLQQNIKCGNSLIDDPEFAGDKAFDWEEEFKEIEEEGGFDVVIGNPPYVSIKGIDFNIRRYYEEKYTTAIGRFDLYALFIERAFQLVRNRGFISFIMPAKYLNNIQFAQSRKLLIENGNISVVFIDDKVFSDASVDSIIIVFQKTNKKKKTYDTFKISNQNLDKLSEIEASIINEKNGYIFKIETNATANQIIKKIQKDTIPLKEICDVKDGIVAGEIKDILFLDEPIDKDSKPLLFGKNLVRYRLSPHSRYVNYKPEKMMKEELKRKKGKRYGLWMRISDIFEKPKILTRKIGTKIIASLDESNSYYEQTLHGTTLKDGNFDLKYILCLLNSRLFHFYYVNTNSQGGRIFPQIRIFSLMNLPIKTPTDDKQKVIVVEVNRMLSLNKRLNEIGDKKTDERARIEEEIKKTDKEIDELVYKLYDLTEEEKKIIEGEGK